MRAGIQQWFQAQDFVWGILKAVDVINEIFAPLYEDPNIPVGKASVSYGSSVLLKWTINAPSAEAQRNSVGTTITLQENIVGRSATTATVQ